MSYALNMVKPRSELHTILVQFRISRGYSQRDLARLLDVTQGYINQVETGRIATPIEYIKSLRKWLTKNEIKEIKQELYRRIDEEIGEGE